MEAVPRLQMLSFTLKKSPEGTSFSSLKKIIAESYQEDAESYSKEVQNLEALRNTAMRPEKNMNGCKVLKRYYSQLHALVNRFPQISESGLFVFHWKDLNSNNVSEITDIKYEMAAVLFNIAALHTEVGATVERSDIEGMKLACTHFQCAAWAFGELKEKFQNINSNTDFMTPELLIFKQQICFAQAQECILEKSLIDNRKPIIVARVTAQIINYYGTALVVLLSGGDDGFIFSQTIDNNVLKLWKKYVKFKISYLSCILSLYQGQHAEEQQKMGERVALYQAAVDKLEEARKESKGLPNQNEILEAITFTGDVVEGKRKNAKNENEFIYHEAIPEFSEITAVQGANLVNGTSFSVTDPDIFGEDIFARLVPMKAHEASSLYSEEKAKILRNIGSQVEEKDNELTAFMSSLNIDNLNISDEQANKIPQGIVDRCALLNAKPNAISDLIVSMSNLAEICVDVETGLRLIKEILDEEEEKEKQYQQATGVHRANTHLTELTREFQKYSEAHQKAGDSNDTLRKAMELHVNNLKILSKSLQEIQQSIPKLSGNVNDEMFKELKLILNKVNEMKAQRAQFHADLRISVNSDDITSKLITHGNSDLKEFFQKELAKHDKIVKLTEQNLAAQSNILTALTDTYAKCASSLKTMSDVKHKKENFFSSLAASYDVYEDLLAKSAKGLEFYKKLYGNIQKLLTRVKSARDVQEEDRKQRIKSSTINKNNSDLNKSGIPFLTTVKDSVNTPKLKDYLNENSLKGFPGYSKVSETSKLNYIPSIRPNPLGSENPSAAACMKSIGTTMSQNNPIYTAVGPNDPPPPYTPSTSIGNSGIDSIGYLNPIYQNNPMVHQNNAYYSAIYQQALANQQYSAALNDANRFSQTISQENNFNPESIQQPNIIHEAPFSQKHLEQSKPASMTNQNLKLNPGNAYSLSNPSNYEYSIMNTSLPQQQHISYPNQIQQNFQSTENGSSAMQTNINSAVVQMKNLNVQNDQIQQQIPISYFQQTQIPNQLNNITKTQNLPSSEQMQILQNKQNNQVYTSQQQQPPQITPLLRQHPNIINQTQENINKSEANNFISHNYGPHSYETQNQSNFSENQQRINSHQNNYQQNQEQQQLQQQKQQQQLQQLQQQQQQQQLIQQQQLQQHQQQQQLISSQQNQLNSYLVPQQLSAYGSHPGYSFNQSNGQYQYGSGYQFASNNQMQYTNSNKFTENKTTSNTTNVNHLAISSGIPVNYNNQNLSERIQPSFQQNNALQQQPNQTLQNNQGQFLQQQQLSNLNQFQVLPQVAGNQEVQQTHLQPMIPNSTPLTYVQSNNNNTTETTISLGSQKGLTDQQTELNSNSNSVQKQISSTKKSKNQAKSKQVKSKFDLLTDSNDNCPVTNLPGPVLQPQVATNYLNEPSHLKSKNNENSNTMTDSKRQTAGDETEDVLPLDEMALENNTQQSNSNTSSLQNEIKISSNNRKYSCDNISIHSDLSSLDQNFDWDSMSIQSIEKNQISNELSGLVSNIPSSINTTQQQKNLDPFDDPKILKYFHKEVEHYEKTIDSLGVKMLNGKTPLFNKWQELQELLAKDESKRSTSIAKLFPEKNRSPDSIPYDHARVVLERNTDDYINAAYMKDLGPGCPLMILAQTPLQNTLNDFWSMIWNHKLRTVVCLHTPNEILDTFWPQNNENELNFDDFSIKFLKQKDLSHCIEYHLNLSMNGADAILSLSLIQIKAWSKNTPALILEVARNILTRYQQRNEEFNSHSALLMNCLTGSERSGLVALAICAILSTKTKRPTLVDVVDIWYRICSQRKNALRDADNLELSMKIVLCHAHNLLNQRGIMTSYQMKIAQTAAATEKEEIKDPLRELDPLWKLKHEN